MARKPHPHTLLAIALGLLPLLTVAVVLTVAHQQESAQDTSAGEQLTEQATLTPSSTPTPTVQPVAPGTVNSQGMPESVTTFLANFYAAYKAKDRERLSSAFTSDVSSTDQATHSQLFNTPTLFVASSAAQSVTSYAVITSAPQSDGWVVTVKEQRVGAANQAAGEVTTLLVVVPGANALGAWKIESYAHSGSTGKYNGFMLQ